MATTALGGGGVRAAASFRESELPGGTLFVHARGFAGQSGLEGIFAVDLANNAWRQVTPEGRPYSRVSPNGKWLAIASTGGAKERARGVWILAIEDDVEP